MNPNPIVGTNTVEVTFRLAHRPGDPPPDVKMERLLQAALPHWPQGAYEIKQVRRVRHK